MDYKEQLKDRRWRVKRVEILKRDRHTCQICGYLGAGVNVHHRKYTGMAWEATNDDLITLCKECHKITHKPDLNDKKFEQMRLGNIIRRNYAK